MNLEVFDHMTMRRTEAVKPFAISRDGRFATLYPARALASLRRLGQLGRSAGKAQPNVMAC